MINGLTCEHYVQFDKLQLLVLIGESFEHSDDINGAVVNIRPRGDKICKKTKIRSTLKRLIIDLCFVEQQFGQLMRRIKTPFWV